MKSKTLAELRKNREYTTDINDVEDIHYVYDEDKELVEGFYIYEGLGVIEKHNDGRHQLIFDRAIYHDRDLAQLEAIFWDDFIREENGISDQDYHDNDLQPRAKKLLNEINETCSLDEVDLNNHNHKVQAKITYLLNQFNKL
jgi:hypothetical protein